MTVRTDIHACTVIASLRSNPEEKKTFAHANFTLAL